MKASINQEIYGDIVLTLDGRKLDGSLLIKDEIYDKAIIMIKEREEDDVAAQ